MDTVNDEEIDWPAAAVRRICTQALPSWEDAEAPSLGDAIPAILAAGLSRCGEGDEMACQVLRSWLWEGARMLTEQIFDDVDSDDNRAAYVEARTAWVTEASPRPQPIAALPAEFLNITIRLARSHFPDAVGDDDALRLAGFAPDVIARMRLVVPLLE
jgi:hypothetical protein